MRSDLTTSLRIVFNSQFNKLLGRIQPENPTGALKIEKTIDISSLSKFLSKGYSVVASIAKIFREQYLFSLNFFAPTDFKNYKKTSFYLKKPKCTHLSNVKFFT